MTPLPFPRPRLWSLLLALLFLLVALQPAAAQDTRGSLVPGTKVTLTDGREVAVEDLEQGQVLWTGTGKLSIPGKVVQVRRQHTDSYYVLKAAGVELQATGSHRVVLADGRMVRLDTLKAGDQVTLWGPAGPAPVPVTSVRVLPATLIAYDLTVEGHRAFRAGGFLVAD